LNSLLNERNGRIQGLRAASTIKRSILAAFGYRRNRDDGTAYNEGRQLRRLHPVD
jgi:hypothetical protein